MKNPNPVYAEEKDNDGALEKRLAEMLEKADTIQDTLANIVIEISALRKQVEKIRLEIQDESGKEV